METGKAVAKITFPDRPHEFNISITAKDGLTMEILNEYQGDRSDIWVVVFKENKEIERHNVKYIESIIWE